MSSRAAAWAGTFIIASLTMPGAASALPEIASGFELEVGCQTCHENAFGGEGCFSPPCLNPFGDAYRAVLITGADPVWGPGLGNVDHDGDGYTSAQELGDLNFDGIRDRSDWPARSPGLADGLDGLDMNECELGFAECPLLERCINRSTRNISDRPSFECDCDPTVTESRRDDEGMCIPSCEAGFERYGGDCVRACEPGFERRADLCVRRFVPPRAVDLRDGVWTDVPVAAAIGGVWETACSTEERVGGYAVYFRYPNDCPEGEVWVESEVATVLAVQGSRSGAERSCEDGSPILLDPELMVRVPLSAGRVRASCRPRPSSGSSRLVSEDGPTCGTAIVVTDGMHTIDLAPTAVPSPFPEDACSAALQSDLWLSYTATCEGRMVVDFADPEWCREIMDHTVGLYPATACPDRFPSYACEYWANRMRDDFSLECGGEEGARASISVRLGEQMLIRLDGAQGLFRFVDDVAISCVDGAECDSSFCAEGALCDDGMGAVACLCPSGWTGDAIPIERGGSGCTPPPRGPDACEVAGFTCDEDGSCIVRWETSEEFLERLRLDPDSDPQPLRIPFCQCDRGYFGSGLSCAEIDECADGTHGCPVNAVCVNETPGNRCECPEGYQADAFSDELECVVICGDGEVGPGEECDDANTADGDGCSTLCEVEPTFRCFRNIPPATWCESTCNDDLIDEDDDLCPTEESTCNLSPCASAGATKDDSKTGLGAVLCMLGLGISVYARRRRRE